jgi:hypothetical protein
MARYGSLLIEVGHPLARITPQTVGELLADELVYVANSFTPGGELGYVRHTQWQRLVKPDGRGGLLVLTGLVGLVRERLSKAGCEVHVEDRRRFEPRLQPCLTALKADCRGDQDFLRVIAGEPRALIEACSASDRTRLMAQVCRLFPAARVMIAMNASRRKVLSLRRSLQSAGRMPFHVVAHYPWPFEGGRLVCSLESFGRHHGADFDMVILADAMQALAPSHDSAFARLTDQRVYGFVGSNLTLGSSSRLRLLARFGPVFPWSNQPEPRAVQVHWA